MATELSELELFHRWVGEQLEEGGTSASIEDALLEFRVSQTPLPPNVQNKLQQSLKEVARGEARELDIEAVIARAMERVGEKGIAD